MTELEQKFINARRQAIALDYANLNDMQQQGTMATEGPLLLLAGAGSGKTTVLIHRVANLLRYGRGSDTDEIPIPISEDEVAFLEAYAAQPTPEQRPLMQYLCAVEPARPWEVLAITFTNKAANELKERLGRPVTCGRPPSTPPASASCGGTSSRSGTPGTSPSTTPTTASGW